MKRTRAVLREIALLLGIVLLIPLTVVVIGAPLVLLVRVLLELVGGQ